MKNWTQSKTHKKILVNKLWNPLLLFSLIYVGTSSCKSGKREGRRRKAGLFFGVEVGVVFGETGLNVLEIHSALE